MQEYPKLDKPEILSQLFHPRQEAKTALPEGAFDIDFIMDQQCTLGCRFYIHGKTSPSILYFHGNGEIVCDHDEIASEYVNSGCNLLVMSYRGYGWSTGYPTVKSFFSDARKLFAEVEVQFRDLGFSGPIFVMGRSLGSACAIDLALKFRNSIKGLILESGFADTLPLLELLGVSLSGSDITENDCFRNREKISQVTLPTLILHGALDQLIPVSEAEKLQMDSAARSKQFFVIPGAAHNTMITTAGKHYFLTIKRFIDTITGELSWRNTRRQKKRDTERLP